MTDEQWSAKLNRVYNAVQNNLENLEDLFILRQRPTFELQTLLESLTSIVNNAYIDTCEKEREN